jgi:AbrB family looped-hinge helix DNA binding protein
MNMLATTKLSSKGQIVIPESIRDQMGLHTGDQFFVMAEKDFVILKTIHEPLKEEFKGFLLKARQAAKKSGLTKSTFKQAIQVARKK